MAPAAAVERWIPLAHGPAPWSGAAAVRNTRIRLVWRETVAVAFESLRSNALRSLLTMLGIIIGVGAVITMVALGSGAQRAIQARIQALGPTLLTVYPGQSFMRGVASGTRVSLTLDDDTALANHARLLTAVVPELVRNLQIKKGDQNINVNVVGTTANYARVHEYGVTTGRMFTAGDDAARRRVAVLGASVPAMLNMDRQAIMGTQILIRGIPFDVVGVLSEKGSQGSFMNPDEQILVPLATARYRVLGTDRLRSITVEAASVDSMNLTMIEIERVLRRQHHIRPGDDNDFQILSPTSILSTFQQTAQTFSALLASIAAISLLVGGIGIMNIMLVSVTERTREIGLRKATGARSVDILLQFLVEALVLALSGGALGIAFGVICAVSVSSIAQWNTTIAPSAVLIAFGFSAAVGLFFGIWPARRAARLDPIEALRYE
ncbi:MAG TPA: ABC transporter permease [Gemmatimonadales bacterium]|nr:ABC transporter permease [Gemmatimonadales bacterium]